MTHIAFDLQETIEKTDANGKLLPEMVSTLCLILHCGCMKFAVGMQKARF